MQKTNKNILTQHASTVTTSKFESTFSRQPEFILSPFQCFCLPLPCIVVAEKQSPSHSALQWTFPLHVLDLVVPVIPIFEKFFVHAALCAFFLGFFVFIDQFWELSEFDSGVSRAIYGSFRPHNHFSHHTCWTNNRKLFGGHHRNQLSLSAQQGGEQVALCRFHSVWLVAKVYTSSHLECWVSVQCQRNSSCRCDNECSGRHVGTFGICAIWVDYHLHVPNTWSCHFYDKYCVWLCKLFLCTWR